ncbi:glycosyltransferase family 4 protein [Serratia rhizosphaerae]|uniref:Glycosyltransferase family 4 protein n=1 Tax=Serratia rhizosphaerae TaxID=2597702 RepID=A0ABX6GS61_9GAMM|nr:glycosyltransferase family 4 protein [Serratia rhizosphaerae]MEB6336455.1 glycosyltransferase family 4 protein [Serratia rhizosphaerae]QHA89052.1 glycosyltransferase family 4 protein [Serratia rhizosphaerae]
MTPRNIAIVIENIAGKGGTERVASGLANALADDGDIRVTLFSLGGEAAFFPLTPAVTLRLMGDRAPFWPWRLARALHRERYDAIITVSMGRLSVVMTPYLRLLCPDSRLLLSEHVSFQQYRWPMRWLKLLVYTLGDRVILLTQQDRARISRWVRQDKCLVIENVSPFAPQPPDEGRRRNVALAIGRLTAQKGFDRLIDAWRQIARQAPSWQLLIVGDGPARPALQRQIAQAGLERHISLLPATPDVARYYRQASLYLMTSRYEGLPMVLIEALSFSLPLVAYDCPTGPAELITSGVNGYLVPDGDRPQFCERVVTLMTDNALRRRFAHASWQQAQRFTPERIYPLWQRIIT